jgi:hypothetical protein
MGILKIPRITEAQRTTAGFIPDVGELLYVTNNKKIYKGDGSTQGGIEVAGGTGAGIEYTTTTGTANTYAATIAGISSYTEGDIYAIKFNVTNTGASTLNISSSGVKSIVKNASTTLEANDILANKIYILVYDGTNFQLVTLGGGGVSGAAGGDLSGTYPNPTVDGLQGNPVSNTTPTIGQVLQFDGTSWIPGAIPTGGSGGGGIVYYFNYGNTTGISPTTGLPTTPVTPSQLGITYNSPTTSIDSANLTNGTYTRVCGFVTIVGTPAVTTIPAGLWDFNIWADVVGNTGGSNQTQFQIRVYKYSSTGAGTYTLLATSDDIFIYDPTEVAQYIGNVTIPQTTILVTDRIYIEFWAQKNVSQSRQISFHFGTDTPSHVHTTLPSVSGTGFVKVTNGVFDPTAVPIIPATSGGTGFDSYTVGDILYATTGNQLLKLPMVAPNSNSVLVSGTTPSWSGNPSLNTLTLKNTASLTLGISGPSGNTGQIIFTNSTNANTITLQSGVTLPSSYTITLPTVAASGVQFLATTGTGGTLTWASGTTTGVSGFLAIDSATKSATNGAVISGPNLIMQTADASNSGLVSTSAQAFAGVKTFTSPSITTSLTTTSTSFALLDSTATTINFGGAATSLTIGNFALSTGTKTLNLGTGIANANAATVVNIGSEQLLSSPSSAINLRNFTYLHPGSTTVGPPAFSSRTVGTRLVFSNVFLAATRADYAMGMGASFLWSGIPLNNSTNSFKWYGGEKEIMSLDGNGTLKLIGEGSQLPKVHTSTTPPSTGNRYLLQENAVAGSAVWWEDGINFGALASSTTRNPAGSTSSYQNSYLNAPASGGGNPSTNFITSGRLSGVPTGNGQFNFFVPDSFDTETTDVGYGKGFLSPTFSFIRKLTNDSNSTTGIVINAPRRRRVTAGTKTITSITRSVNTLTIILNSVTNLVVNQQAGISGITPSESLYNGYSGRILTIDIPTNTITMFYSDTSTPDTTGGTLTPIYREENGGHSNLFFAFDKDADFVPNGPGFQGFPEEVRILWYSTGYYGASGPVGIAPFYGLFTNSVAHLNGSAPTRKLITEKITFAAHSGNISVGEAVTNGSLNLFSFNATENSGFTTGTRTINIGNVTLGGAFPSGTVSTNINIGMSAAGQFAISNTRIFGNVGFYGANAQTKPTVTGSRGANAALTSLCTALATLGLITNSTT